VTLAPKLFLLQFLISATDKMPTPTNGLALFNDVSKFIVKLQLHATLDFVENKNEVHISENCNEIVEEIIFYESIN